MQVASFSLGLLSSCPLDTTILKIRIITEEVIDRTKPSGFFYGSASGNPKVCGVGVILFLKDGHYITFKAGLGVGSNNYAELFALKLLIILALNKQTSNIHIFGDSLLVINWISDKFRVHNMQLAQFLQEVIRFANFFDQAVFKHIYTERNTCADKLANEGGKVQSGFWFISEYQGSGRHATFQVF